MKDVNEITHDPVIVLVGNKTDLIKQRKVSYETALQYAEKNSMHYFEVSAKDQKKSIDGIFELMAEEILARIEKGKIDCQNPIYGVSSINKINKNQSK